VLRLSLFNSSRRKWFNNPSSKLTFFALDILSLGPFDCRVQKGAEISSNWPREPSLTNKLASKMVGLEVFGLSLAN
jgi:hypothetical protein